MPSSCLRFILCCALLWFFVPVFAADRNLTEADDVAYHGACERLLEGDLSGFFIATNQTTKAAQFIQLRRLGATSAYTVATATLELASTGVRELEFSRTADGWLIGDPRAPTSRVNIMTIRREGGRIEFSFENVNDAVGFAYIAAPVEDKKAIRGDILNPKQWTLQFSSAMDNQIQFTRVKLDRSFELSVSQSLKSLLAKRLDPGEHNPGDFVITVEMKRPMLPDEARDILGSAIVYPLEETNGPYYRFAVPKSITEFLEIVGDWNRHWEVARIDVMPARLFHPELIGAIIDHAKSVTQNAGQPPQTNLPSVQPTDETRDGSSAGGQPETSSSRSSRRLTTLRMPRSTDPRDLDPGEQRPNHETEPRSEE